MPICLCSDLRFVNKISTRAGGLWTKNQGITVPPFRKSHKSLTKPLIPFSSSRLCAFARTPFPLNARVGLIILTQRRKGTKKKTRERDNFKECGPFKKPRKSQEVDAESIYLKACEIWKMASGRQGALRHGG
jgi:hypothetical protein